MGSEFSHCCEPIREQDLQNGSAAKYPYIANARAPYYVPTDDLVTRYPPGYIPPSDPLAQAYPSPAKAPPIGHVPHPAEQFGLQGPPPLPHSIESRKSAQQSPPQSLQAQADPRASREMVLSNLDQRLEACLGGPSPDAEHLPTMAQRHAMAQAAAEEDMKPHMSPNSAKRMSPETGVPNVIKVRPVSAGGAVRAEAPKEDPPVASSGPKADTGDVGGVPSLAVRRARALAAAEEEEMDQQVKASAPTVHAHRPLSGVKESPRARRGELI